MMMMILSDQLILNMIAWGFSMDFSDDVTMMANDNDRLRRNDKLRWQITMTNDDDKWRWQMIMTNDDDMFQCFLA